MTKEAEIIAAVEDGDAEIRTGFDRVIAGSSNILAWAIFAAFVITVVEVIARYVFDSPTFWAHESTTFLIAATFLIGGPIALARDKHIRVRMFYDAVTPARRRLLDIVNSVIALVFFAGLAYAGWIMVGKSWFSPIGELRLEGTGTSWNPPTPALLKMLVLVAVGVMFVQTLLHLIAAIRRDVSSPSTTAGEK
ncbi:TRAP transporter small permease [Devosia sp. XJ19-1]|uniref:TRAP transporter small permease protein n=1 Tax=Devosia ureilytica TaxID=2952754 RepID=A0A9Q4AP09_9HYPH|nr:TRAP transporter small permease [Devosia ureilytica]MCP8883864.1 TRAP transporter small permease [Devosia ureilytica]MCP8887472.1 TRAP transporter small permease [Devosia ureilytica]